MMPTCCLVEPYAGKPAIAFQQKCLFDLHLSCPQIVVRFHLSFAVSIGISVTTKEPDYRVAIFVCAIHCSASGFLAIGIHNSLRNQSHSSQNSWMPLDNMFLLKPNRQPNCNQIKLMKMSK